MYVDSIDFNNFQQPLNSILLLYFIRDSFMSCSHCFAIYQTVLALDKK